MGKEVNAVSILTRREIEYLTLVAMGYKNQEISKILFVSRSTVKKTLENIFIKLNAKDRANAVAIGFIHKLLTPELIAITKTYYPKKNNNPDLQEYL